jgi:hypothetical protein
MKIYLADTIQREHLKYHNDIYICNHLESYFKLINKNIKGWKIYENKNK